MDLKRFPIAYHGSPDEETINLLTEMIEIEWRTRGGPEYRNPPTPAARSRFRGRAMQYLGILRGMGKRIEDGPDQFSPSSPEYSRALCAVAEKCGTTSVTALLKEWSA